MPTYITLARWTQTGIEKVKESPNRLDAAKSVFQQAGAELKEFYLTMGQYDMLAIGEAPDDETPQVPSVPKPSVRSQKKSIGRSSRPCPEWSLRPDRLRTLASLPWTQGFDG
jgi:hypothetical protein